MSAVACWHCGADAGLRSRSFGVAMCGVECRDAVARLDLVRVPVASLGGTVLEKAAPSLCGAKGRWRALDNTHFLVPQHIGAKLERIGNGPPDDGGAVSSSSSDASRKRSADSMEPDDAQPQTRARGVDVPPPPLIDLLPEDKGMGYLDRMVANLKPELVKYLGLHEQIMMAPHSKDAYNLVATGIRELTTYVTTGGNIQFTHHIELATIGLSLVDALDIAGSAATRNDSVTFNSAIHMAFAEIVLALGNHDMPRETERLFYGKRRADSRYKHVGVRYDYALMCHRDTLNLFLWLWHVRRTNPANAAIVSGITTALLHFVELFVRLSYAEDKFFRILDSRAKIIDGIFVNQSNTLLYALLIDRPLVATPRPMPTLDLPIRRRDLSKDDDDTFFYTVSEKPVDPAKPSTLWLKSAATARRDDRDASKIFLPDASRVYGVFNANLVTVFTQAIAAAVRHGGPMFDQAELLRLYPNCEIAAGRRGVTDIPPGHYAVALAPRFAAAAAAGPFVPPQPLPDDDSDDDSDADDDDSDADDDD